MKIHTCNVDSVCYPKKLDDSIQERNKKIEIREAEKRVNVILKVNP